VQFCIVLREVSRDFTAGIHSVTRTTDVLDLQVARPATILL